MIEIYKICHRCEKEKLLNEFYKNSRNKTDGHKGQCKVCCDKAKKIRLIKTGTWKNRKYTHEKDGLLFCVKCEEYKEPDSFYKDKNSSTGKKCRCKVCDDAGSKISKAKARINATRCVTEGCNNMPAIGKECRYCYNTGYNQRHRKAS